MENQRPDETRWSKIKFWKIHLQFRFWAIIWTSIKIFGIVMDTKTTYGLIMRFSTMQHARHLESHHAPLYPHRTLWRYTNVVLLLLLLYVPTTP